MSGVKPQLLFVAGADEFNQRTRRRFGNDVITAGQNMQKRRRDIGQVDTITTVNHPVCHQRVLTHHSMICRATPPGSGTCSVAHPVIA